MSWYEYNLYSFYFSVMDLSDKKKSPTAFQENRLISAFAQTANNMTKLNTFSNRTKKKIKRRVQFVSGLIGNTLI